MSTAIRDDTDRTYRQSHSWINFEADLQRAGHRLWMLIGEAESKCQHIAGVPLRPDVARKLYEVYLSKGVHATTSIEGNTLSEKQVQEQIEGNLRLPKSQEYLGVEVQNILDACNEIASELLRNPATPLTAERICHFNALVLRGLDVDDETRPGEICEHSVGVGNYRGAPAEDCPHLVARLCGWLDSDLRAPSEDMKFAYALIKAVLAHLYIAWIHPFGDGNGRTARLIEFQLLVQSGLVPFPSAHLLSNHYNKTRTRYYTELDRSSKARDGVVSFLEYAIQGFVDGLREQLDYIRAQQLAVTWENYVHNLFRGKDTQAYRRQKHLVLDMPAGPTSRKDLMRVSARIAAEYAGKGEKTLSRDINALLGMGLIVRRGRDFVPNRGAILAFLPHVAKDRPESS
jgi:Fic family protein